MSQLEIYFDLLDIVRESRRAPSWRAENDRPLLEQLQDIYEQLTPDERDEVEGAGWRAWPDEFDARERRSSATAELVEVLLDASEMGPVPTLPRHARAA